MGSSRSTTADGGHKSSGRYSREVHHSLSTWTYSPSLLTFTISILTCCIPTLSVSPNLCSRPPPPLDCGGIYNGEGFYYNASSPTPCLRWPDWSCLENSMFSTIDECMSTCVPETSSLPTSINTPTDPPTMSAEEICKLPIRNTFCFHSHTTDLWVYNKDQQKCHELAFLNCLPVQKNMFDTEEECISTCGPYSPHYTDREPQLPPSAPPSSSQLIPAPSPSFTLPTSSQPALAPPSVQHTFFSPLTHPPSVQHTTSSSPLTHPPSTVSTSPQHAPHPSTQTTDHFLTTKQPAAPINPPTTSQLYPTPIVDQTTPTIHPLPSTIIEIETPAQSTSPRLSVFDYASIGVGAVALLLIVVLVIVVSSLIHRRRVHLQRRASSVKGPPVAATNPCKHQGNGVDVNFVTKHSYPTTAHYV
jgi:hypothetical protein